MDSLSAKSLLNRNSISGISNNPPPLPQSELLKDIHHHRIKQIILSHPSIHRLIHLSQNTNNRLKMAQTSTNNRNFLQQSHQRKWLANTGKKYLIDFDNKERKKMKVYFNSLDKHQNGSIGVDQLEELLLSVGLLETREEVKALVDLVDEDKSGKIQFQEFLSMILNEERENQQIISFFKRVIQDKSRQQAKNSKTLPIDKSIDEYPQGLPFDLIVSHIKRKHLMTALKIGRGFENEPLRKSIEGQEKCIDGKSEKKLRDDEVRKGKSVMKALQKMNERRLLREVKDKNQLSADKNPLNASN